MKIDLIHMIIAGIVLCLGAGSAVCFAVRHKSPLKFFLLGSTAAAAALSAVMYYFGLGIRFVG
jgi:hypothetical protein